MKSMIIALSAITLIATAPAGFAKSVSSKTPRALPVTLRVKRLVPTQSADNNLRRTKSCLNGGFFRNPTSRWRYFLHRRCFASHGCLMARG
jgi:hypothetical protein